jgi:hypothetical protein
MEPSYVVALIARQSVSTRHVVLAAGSTEADNGSALVSA